MIDVVVLTKNSEQHSPLFKKCLETLYYRVPVNRLIAVDGFSTDQTIPILQTYKAEIHQIPGNRAVARQYGIDQVDTEWFLFLDDDVVLAQNWFKKASRHMNNGIGLIWGWDRPIAPQARNRIKISYYLRRLDECSYLQRSFNNIGGTQDTLIRLEAVAGIKIPTDLHFFEDWYIKQYVLKQGFRTVAPRDLWCYHWYTPDDDRHNRTLFAQLAKKYQLESTAYVFFKMLLAFPKALGGFLLTGDWKMGVKQFRAYGYNFLAHLGLRLN